MDIKSHTIVRGQSSSSNFVLPNKEVTATTVASRNLVTRSNSLRRVETPPPPVKKNVNFNIPEMPENAKLAEIHAMKMMYSNNNSNNPSNNQLPGHFFAQPQQQPLMGPNYNIANTPLNQQVFTNKTRYGMLPQPQQPQFVPSAMMNGNVNLNHLNTIANHSSNVHPSTQHQISPTVKYSAAMSTSSTMPHLQQKQQHPTLQYSNHINQANMAGGTADHINNNNHHVEMTKLATAASYSNDINANFSNLTIKSQVSDMSRQANGNHVSPISNHSSPSTSAANNNNIQNEISAAAAAAINQQSNNLHKNIHVNGNNLQGNNNKMNGSANLVEMSNDAYNNNFKESSTNKNVFQPANQQNTKEVNTNHVVNAQPKTVNNGSNSINKHNQQQPQVPAHAQQRVTHEQFRATLQMVVSTGDPR